MSSVISFVSALAAVLALALPGPRWQRYRRRGVAAVFRRHAPNTQVVSISGFVDGDNVLRFAVTDAGPTERRTARWRSGRGGFGLVGLAARIEALGGTRHAGPTVDGWSVTAVLPLQPGTVGSPK